MMRPKNRMNMIKRLIFLLTMAFCACNGPSNSKSLYRFYNTHLFFDLNEEVERHPCKIQGHIPSWLSGTLLRNGPAKFSVGGEKRVTWFDGLPMLHAFEFSFHAYLMETTLPPVRSSITEGLRLNTAFGVPAAAHNSLY